VFADGAPVRTLDGAVRSLVVGPFDAADTRRFNVAAIDTAGNDGTLSTTLVGVPNIVGLTKAQATDALAARKLVFKAQELGFGVGTGVVTAQTPAAPAVVAKGSTVQALLAETPSAETPLVARVRPTKVVCVRGHRTLQLSVALSKRASVTWSMFDRRRIGSGALGSLPAGVSRVRIRMPRQASHPGRYRLVVTARAQGHAVSSTVQVALTSSLTRSSQATSCG
jgi:hypothetical protein